MAHIQPEALQQYLAGEISLPDAEQIDEHLACCTRCTDLLANLAAEDATLTQMLQLDADEMSWVIGTDLTHSVMQSVRRPAWNAQVLIPTLFLVATGSWGLQVCVNLLQQPFADKGLMKMAADVLPLAFGLLWQVLLYLADGGLLTTIWPAFAAGAIVCLWRWKRMEGVHHASRMG